METKIKENFKKQIDLLLEKYKIINSSYSNSRLLGMDKISHKMEWITENILKPFTIEGTKIINSTCIEYEEQINQDSNNFQSELVAYFQTIVKESSRNFFV